MKGDYIYLDWNVIKKLAKSDVNSTFYVAIFTLKKQYFIPFSFAHLCDRHKNLSQETMPLIAEDLNFVKRLSDDYMLGRYEDDFDLAKMDIFKKYDEVTNAGNTRYPNFTIPEEIVNIALSEGLESFFKKNENIKWFPPMALAAFGRFNCDYRLYKEFRKIYSSKTPIPELSFFNDLQNSSLTAENLKDIVNRYLAFGGDYSPKMYRRLQTAYLLLDFNPTYREKMNPKTNFTNMYTDSEHMLNTSHAKYYITEDSKAIRRTKFVFEAYGIKTNVFNIVKFLDYIAIGCCP